jgi:hypothetical protein
MVKSLPKTTVGRPSKGLGKVKERMILSKILDKRVVKGKVEYLVGWKGKEQRKDWVPATKLAKALKLIN